MRIFISWSGEPSRSVACALRDWLPLVAHHTRPWMSDDEIRSGTRWNDAIARALNETDFGIVCVTRENQHRPWLTFEAGALAKRLETARVVPLCVDIAPAEITGPLEAFQGCDLDEHGLRRLVHDISSAREYPLSNDQVDKLFNALWPELQRKVEGVRRTAPEREPVRRSNEDMLEELVERVRGIERERDSIDKYSANIVIERLEIHERLLSRLLDEFRNFAYRQEGVSDNLVSELRARLDDIRSLLDEEEEGATADP